MEFSGLGILLGGNKPECSMYGLFTYSGLDYMLNVGKYSLHGAFGKIRSSGISHICLCFFSSRKHVGRILFAHVDVLELPG